MIKKRWQGVALSQPMEEPKQWVWARHDKDEAEVDMLETYREFMKKSLVHSGGENMTTMDKGLKWTSEGQFESEAMKKDVEVSRSDGDDSARMED